MAVGAAAQEPAPQPAGAPTAEAEAVVTWGGEVDLVSQYIWRGLPYSEGLVVWPTAWVSAYGVTASLFLNYDPNWDPTWNEYDLTFSYERSVGRWTLDGTYTRYVLLRRRSKRCDQRVDWRRGLCCRPGRDLHDPCL